MRIVSLLPAAAGLPVRAGRVRVVDGPASPNRPEPRLVRGVEVLAHLPYGVGELFPDEAIRLGAAPAPAPPELRGRLSRPGELPAGAR